MKTTAAVLAITICFLEVAMSAEKAFVPRFSDAPSVEATRLHLNVVGAYRLVSDKTKFHLNNLTRLAASLPSGRSGNDHYSFEFLNRADHPYDNAVGEGSTDITW